MVLTITRIKHERNKERSQGYVSLNEIINRTLFQMGETGTQKKLVALTHAQDIWRKLNFDVMRNVKTVVLPLDAAKTVGYPPDYVDYDLIGMPVDGGGIIRAYGRNPNMRPLVTDDCGNEVALDGGVVVSNGEGDFRAASAPVLETNRLAAFHRVHNAMVGHHGIHRAVGLLRAQD